MYVYILVQEKMNVKPSIQSICGVTYQELDWLAFVIRRFTEVFWFMGVFNPPCTPRIGRHSLDGLDLGLSQIPGVACEAVAAAPADEKPRQIRLGTLGLQI